MLAPFNIEWIHGSQDCRTSTDTPLQDFRLAPGTYILRQDKCLNSEGPFLYLLIGTQTALLLDTGAAPRPGRQLPVRSVVQRLLTEHVAATGGPEVSLVVAHSHAHTDHTFGDGQFQGQSRTTVVPPTLAGVRQFFGLSTWPEGRATFDLGERRLTLLPIPGHEAAHIAVYDDATRVLLTGDTLYPGLLTVPDWPQYRQSVRRLAEFAASHPISQVLGAHIEMKRTPRKWYTPRTEYQPEEHALQLGPEHLQELHEACEAMGDSPHRDVHDDFVIEPF
jgi:hydroxyacylglutathione hydrolase